jgi:uncharacterized protein
VTAAETTVLVTAKAPVPGLAKTRLAATVGDDAAADLAAAALLDTLTAAEAAAGREHRVAALTGDLRRSARAERLDRALRDWRVVPQRGEGFDQRLAAAHADAGPGPVVQVGMDTPQVTADLLQAVADALAGDDAVLGPAPDGGWWVLGLRDPAHAEALVGVPMSTAHTYDDTRAALLARGLRVGTTATLRDVDDAADAEAVAAAAPGTLFARAWRRLQDAGQAAS